MSENKGSSQDGARERDYILFTVEGKTVRLIPTEEQWAAFDRLLADALENGD